MPSQSGSIALKAIFAVSIIALSFSTTTILLGRLDGSNRATVLPSAQVVLCRVPLAPTPPKGDRNGPILREPIVIVGDTNAADIVYMANRGQQAMIGIADWGHADKTATVDVDSLNNATLVITFNYSQNVISVVVGNSEILRSVGNIVGKFTSRNIFIGQNPIGFPGVAPSFPDIVKQARAGAATCAAHG